MKHGSCLLEICTDHLENDNDYANGLCNTETVNHYYLENGIEMKNSKNVVYDSGSRDENYTQLIRAHSTITD